jgi:hypothetical protein
MAKIYPLHLPSDPQGRRQMQEIKSALTAEYLAFFLLTPDTSTQVGAAARRGLKVMPRPYELLMEARDQFEREFI